MPGGLLANKRIAVTGPHGQLGQAVCATAAEAGATVVPVPHHVWDVTCQTTTVPPVWRHYFDGVVHCAGILGPVGRMCTQGTWDPARVVDVNLVGTLNTVHWAIAAALRESKPISIVCVAGGGASDVLPGFTAYAASKAGVVRAVECLAEEYGEVGVRINALAPGPMPGTMRQAILAAGDAAGKVRGKHAEGADTTQVAASCACWLLSDRASGVNGRYVSAPYDLWPPTEPMADDRWRLRRVP